MAEPSVADLVPTGELAHLRGQVRELERRLERTTCRMARLRRHARMAVRVREDLLAMASHDLRTPLGIVSMKAESIRNTGVLHAMPAQTAGELDAILRHVQYMERLVGDLMDVARIRSGKVGIVGCREDLVALLRQAVDAVRPMAGTRRLSFASLVHEPCEVVCDKQRIFQVMSNLLHNAVKYTRAEGRIRVRLLSAAQEVRVAVQDDGLGIPEYALPYVFRRYWNATERPTRGSAQGIGLGLFIARSIVRAHGGSIWVRSALGTGSTFYFSLPRAGERASASA